MLDQVATPHHIPYHRQMLARHVGANNPAKYTQEAVDYEVCGISNEVREAAGRCEYVKALGGSTGVE